MNTAIDHHEHETKSSDGRRRQIRIAQLIFAGAATIATLALFNVVQPDGAESVAASGSVHLVDQASYGGFAADDPSNPGWNPPPEPQQSQPDPGWNADPGWDFQPSPEN
jgi:hypothetical protein